MFEKEVAAGAAWLDEEYPGWEGRIDFSNLDILYCEKCIIGQAVFGYVYEQGTIADVVTDENRWMIEPCQRGDRIMASNAVFYSLHDTPWRRAHGFELAEWSKVDGAALEATWEALVKERYNSGLLSG